MSKRAAGGRKSKAKLVHELFATHMRELKIDAIAEHRFYPERQWKADFWLAEMVGGPSINYMFLVEINGGQFSGGHRRGFLSKKRKEQLQRAGKPLLTPAEDECIKLSTAAAMGYKVLHFTPQQVERGDAKLFIKQEILGQKGREG